MSDAPVARVRIANPSVADPASSMTPRFQLFFRWFARRFFQHLDFDEATVARYRGSLFDTVEVGHSLELRASNGTPPEEFDRSKPDAGANDGGSSHCQSHKQSRSDSES